MAHADLKEAKIHVWTDWREKDLVKMIPGAKWNATDRTWTIPVSWSSCKVLRGVFQNTLTVGDNLAKWAWDELNTRINPCLELREALDVPESTDPNVKAVLIEVERQLAERGLNPFTFQRAGAVFLAKAYCALLADEMGTGKTIQTIIALRILHDLGHDVFPALVIAPNTVTINWRNEFATWWPGIRTEIVKGGAQKRKKILDGDADVYIINWEAVRLHSRLAPYGSVRLSDEEKLPKELNGIPFRTVVADEAHKLKNPQAKQTRAVWQVGHQPTVEFRFALTGTPLANAPDDLWSLLHFVEPSEWPQKTRYVDRYCQLSWNAWGGMDVLGIRPETRDEFFSILDPRMRRMPKELVLPFLPPKLRQPRYTEMSTKQAKAYKAMAEEMIVETDDGQVIVATNNLTRNTRLSQFASSYAEVNENNDVRLTDPSNKLDELMEILEELGDDEPLVVAAESRQLIELAVARLEKAQHDRIKANKSPQAYTYSLITGGQTTDERAAAVQNFQTGVTRICLFTIQAGGVGLTLTRGRVLVFLQRSWSMLNNVQAEDRVHRIGSEVHDNILIIDLVTPGTVEEGQIERLYVKFQRLQEIMRDKDLVQKLGDQARLAELEAEEAAILASDLSS